jgi:glycosyltransferase EpsE
MTIKKNSTQTKISILMPVYNCAEYLPAAIESILNQTYTNWELIICDDGSTDDTYAAAQKFAKRHPKKIVLLQNSRNLKMNKTLNRCLKQARGQLIARMDGDDTCDPNRLQVEYDFLTKHPEYDIVSCDMSLFDETGTWGVDRFPQGAVQPHQFVKKSPFCHGGCMVRKDAFTTVCGYSEDARFVRVEDYDLWVRMYAAGFRGYGLGKVLYSMRFNKTAIGRRNKQNYINDARVKREAIRLLHLPKWYYLLSLRPLVVMLLPRFLYASLHKAKYSK